MQKITTLLIIILFLCACGKINKNTETTQDSASVIITEAESQPLTEAECWELFDEFWIEFQSAIINDDTNKIKTMCKLEDFDCNEANYSLEFFINRCFFSYKNKKTSKYKEYSLKEFILMANKNNNYKDTKKIKHNFKINNIVYSEFGKVNIKYFKNLNHISDNTIKDNNVYVIEMECYNNDDFVCFCAWGCFALRNNKYKLIGFFGC